MSCVGRNGNNGLWVWVWGMGDGPAKKRQMDGKETLEGKARQGNVRSRSSLRSGRAGGRTDVSLPLSRTHTLSLSRALFSLFSHSLSLAHFYGRYLPNVLYGTGVLTSPKTWAGPWQQCRAIQAANLPPRCRASNAKKAALSHLQPSQNAPFRNRRLREA